SPPACKGRTILARQELFVSDEVVRQVRIDTLQENAVVSNRQATRPAAGSSIRRDGRPSSHAATGPDVRPPCLRSPGDAGRVTGPGHRSRHAAGRVRPAPAVPWPPPCPSG